MRRRPASKEDQRVTSLPGIGGRGQKASLLSQPPEGFLPILKVELRAGNRLSGQRSSQRSGDGGPLGLAASCPLRPSAAAAPSVLAFRAVRGSPHRRAPGT